MEMEQPVISQYGTHEGHEVSLGTPPLNRATPYRRSYVNDAVEVLRSVGRSMKLQELQAGIGEKRGKAVSLGSLKVCLSRYVDTEDDSKLLTRIAPGLFALTEWAGMNISYGNGVRYPLDGRFGSLGYLGRGTNTSGLPYRASQSLPLFVWTATADREAGLEEQRVYVRAANEIDVVFQLESAGIRDVARGAVRAVPGSASNSQPS